MKFSTLMFCLLLFTNLKAQHTFLNIYDIEAGKDDQGVWIEKYENNLYAWNSKIFGFGPLYCKFDLEGKFQSSKSKKNIAPYNSTLLRTRDTILIVGKPIIDDDSDSLLVFKMTIDGDSINAISFHDKSKRFTDPSPWGFIKTPTHYVMIANSEPNRVGDSTRLEGSLWYLYHDFTVDTIIPIRLQNYTLVYGLQLGPENDVYVWSFTFCDSLYCNNKPGMRHISIYRDKKLIQEINTESYRDSELKRPLIFLVTRDTSIIYGFKSDISNNSEPSIRCIDRTGKLKWEVFDIMYGQERQYTRIYELVDGNLLALGYIMGEGFARTAYIQKISKDGKMMWERIIGNYYNNNMDGTEGYLWRMVEDSLGYMYVVGQLANETDDMALLKIDAYGCIDQDRCNTYYVLNPLNGEHKYDQINQMQKQWYYTVQDKNGLLKEKMMTIGQDTILYDTINGNVKYKLLYFDGKESDYSLRWDVAGKLYRMYNVYKYDWLSLKRDTVLYDFTLTVGEKFLLPAGFKAATVIQVDSIPLLDGKLRKRIILRHDNPLNQQKFGNLTWIEGIGSPTGLFYYQDWIEGTKTMLNCYFDRNVKRYSDSSSVHCQPSQRAIPLFELDTLICKDNFVFKLPATSSNNINGTWTPKEVDYSLSGEYVCTFEPYFEEDAHPITMKFRIIERRKPIFNIQTIYTINEPNVGALPMVSMNGVNGSWNPSVVNTTVVGASDYTFTPAQSECSEKYILKVEVVHFIDTTDMGVSTMWYSSSYIGEYANGDCRKKIDITEVVGDTLIGNRLCRKVGVTTDGLYLSESEIILYSKDGRLEFFEDNQWKLLYDFTAAVGDTVTYYVSKKYHYYAEIAVPIEYQQYIIDSMPYQLIIKKIDTIYADNNIPLRRFHTERIWNYVSHFMGQIIEGVGSKEKLFGNNINISLPDCNPFEEGVGLKCYSDDDVSIKFVKSNCDMLSSTNETIISNVTLFPNPVQDILLVTIGEYIPERGYIELYYISGQQVHKQRAYYGHNNVDMSGLAEGTYILRFMDGSKMVKEEKVVKVD